jgi:uncharacterized protein (DUF169 family)
MNMQFKEKFSERWSRYFNGFELPIVFYYTDGEDGAEAVKPATTHQCFIGVLSKVRKGKALSFDLNSIGCFGGKRYLGFTQEIMPDFEYFLSCGLPGKVEGERYKRTPQLVMEYTKRVPSFTAPKARIVFKRWDMLREEDDPEVVIFFAPPDVLSGLFTLANFDEADLNAVFTPFCSGCGSIVLYPYLERNSSSPRAVVGMFDVSARPFTPKDTLTFAAPMNKFVRMVENMEESFLITSSWTKVKDRISRKS